MTKQEIQAVISELNRLTVSGEANLDILLGCITFLKSKIVHPAEETTTEEGDQDG